MTETKLIGGELCLDFANTVDWHASDSPQEGLGTYEALVAWGVHVNILDASAAKGVLREAAKRPAAAREVLKRAVALRESMYRMFVRGIAGQSPRLSDLEVINTELSKALPHLRVANIDDQYTWEWAHDAKALDRMLWPVLRSAADVLTTHKRATVGQCDDDRGCGWLFLDSSKNHSRRWCSMEDCGNRAKVLRHYKRSRRSDPKKRR
jgi:predicted RNA-binding Zn ribbon-like protein